MLYLAIINLLKLLCRCGCPWQCQRDATSDLTVETSDDRLVYIYIAWKSHITFLPMNVIPPSPKQSRGRALLITTWTQDWEYWWRFDWRLMSNITSILKLVSRSIFNFLTHDCIIYVMPNVYHPFIPHYNKIYLLLHPRFTECLPIQCLSNRYNIILLLPVRVIVCMLNFF